MMPVAELSAAFANPNVYAFYHVMRHGESTHGDDAYTLINGGSHFTDFSRHPYEGQRSPPGRAAGAPQFLASTWADVAKRIGATDFGPGWQDLGYVDLLRYRGALDDVTAGRFEAACIKCRPEWTSLPGAAENSGRYTLAKAKAVYEQYGGTYAPAVTPLPVGVSTEPVADNIAATAAPKPPQPTGAPMPILALLAAFGPVIAQLIPQIASVMQPKGEVAQRNVKLAEVAFGAITQAAGAVNVQDAVDRMKADPALTAQVTAAVVTHPEIVGYMEVGEGGVKAAREASVAMQNSEKSFLYNPAFWISLALLVYPTLLLVDVLFVHPDNYTENLRTQIVTGVLAVIMLVGGFWLGSSVGSQRKTEIAASGSPVA